MARISTDTLFHFTDSLKNLIGILEKGFWPLYSLEPLHKVKLIIPLVSLCDIPLTQMRTHIETYGKYGVGLTKDWGHTYRLNPVTYISADSHLEALWQRVKSVNES